MIKKRAFLVIGGLVLLGILIVLLAVRGSKGSLDKANRYYQDGDFVRALLEYQAVLQEKPETLTAYKQIAAIWMNRGNPIEALRYLNSALIRSPDDLEARRQRAEAYGQLGQMAALHEEALTILEQVPNDREALLHLIRSSLAKPQIEETLTRLEKVDADRDAIALLGQGIILARNGKLEEAQASLQKALTLDPKWVPIHETIANLYFLGKAPEKGAEAFKKAAQLAPIRSATQINYARALQQSGRVAEALAHVEEMTSKAPDYLPAWTQLALLLAEQDKFTESLAALEKVFALDPRNLDAQSTKSQILAAQGKLEEAIETLKVLDETYTGLPLIKLTLAGLQVKHGQVEEAHATLEEALRVYPGHVQAELLLAELNLRTNRDQPKTIKLLEELLKRQPNLLQARLLLSSAYQSSGRFEDAAQLFLSQLGEDPMLARPHYMLGMIRNRQKEWEKAREHFEAAQNLAPEDLNVTGRLVELDVADQQFDSAHRRVRQQLQHEMNLAGGYHLEGQIFMAEEKWPEAEAALMKSLELNPKSLSTYNTLIQCYLKTRKPPEAIATVQEVLKDNPKSLTHLNLLARLLETEGNYEEAAAAYRQVLSLSPEFVPALNNLAYLYTEHLPDLEQALALAQKAQKLDPEPAAVSDTLGWIYYKRKDYNRALLLLEEAARSTSDGEILYHVGMARFMTGNQAGAEEALRKAVDSEKEFSGKEVARQRLEALGRQTVAQLEARVQANPSDLIARTALGEVYEQSGQFEKARANYSEALEINGESIDALLGMARLSLGPLQDLAQAGTLARKARTLAPDDPRTAGALGQVVLRERDYKLATGLLEAALRAHPEDATLQRDFGIAAYHLGRSAEATAALQRATSLAPASEVAAQSEAFLELITPPADGNWTSLLPAAERKLQADPESIPALMIRAAVQTSNGDRKAAMDAYEAITARLPEFIPAQKELIALLTQNPADLERAYSLGIKTRATLRDAQRNDPGLSTLLGEICLRKGDAETAIQFLEEVGPSLDAKGLFYLGMAYLETGASEKGKSTLQRALDAGLDEQLTREAKAALAP